MTATHIFLADWITAGNSVNQGCGFVVDKLERMKAIVAQAIAEAKRLSGQPDAVQVRLNLYGDCDETEVLSLFAQASRGTLLEKAQVITRQVGTRYVCWNCCGLRFDGLGGVCPNCGELAFEIPNEISFSLLQVSTAS
jgi:Zn finger protein HypA/HybF involved in hydrogenase expression